MIKPKTLQKGDLIAIAAPASPFDKEEFLKGVKKIRELGFEVTFRKDIFSKKNYLAGNDDRRAEELNGFFADPAVKAIFFARGGYGTQRILHMLDLEAIKASPKIIMGYSDLTALHIWLHRHGVGGTFYGPTVAKHFRLAPKKTFDILLETLFGSRPTGPITTTGARAMKRGCAEGMLIGGCLSLITSSIGTQYDLNTDGSILFLEDVGEPVYRYDRMFTQLISSGKLRDVKGIIFGSLGISKGENNVLLKKMIKERFHAFPGPIITDFPSGHYPLDKLFVTIPLGVAAKISTDPLKIEIVEPALA